MSLLSVSDVFASVKDWFVQLPGLIKDNLLVSIAVIVAAVAVVALVITLIVVSVKKSRKKRAAKTLALTAEQQPEEVANAQPSAHEAAEVQPAQEDAAASLWKEVLAEVYAAAPANVQAPVAESVSPAEQPAAAAPAKQKAAKPAAAAKAEPGPAGAKVRAVDEEGWYVRTLYNRSFQAKLIQSDQIVKDFYSRLKNELLAYDTVARISWKHESFRLGRNTRARFVIRRKTLCLCLALDPKDYAASKYLVDDMSRYSSYANMPLMYKIKNARRCRYAVELITRLFGTEPRIEREEEDFSDIPYQETLPLVEEGLIKVVRTERVRLVEGQEPVAEVFVADEEDEGFDNDIDEMDEVEASAVDSLMGDEFAKSLLAESTVYSDKTRQCIVNIEVLGRFFEDGETVTLEELKKRVPIIDKRATYIKVLARGRLNKALVIIADDFSIEAVKMIALTGGRAVRNKRR